MLPVFSYWFEIFEIVYILLMLKLDFDRHVKKDSFTPGPVTLRVLTHQ